MPPYIVCTNRQLALIAHGRYQSLSALDAVEGFGKKKIEKCGKEILGGILGLPQALLKETPAAGESGAPGPAYCSDEHHSVINALIAPCAFLGGVCWTTYKLRRLPW